MATRDYWLAFGSGLPSSNSGLAPTFIIFLNGSGQTLTPPSITETYSGSGLYKFAYEATQTIAFVVDGATSGLATTDRYISGVLDPQDSFGVTLNAIGLSQFALGNSLMAYGSSSIALGTTAVAIGLSGYAQGQANGTTLVAQGSTIVAIGDTLSALGISGIDNLAALIGDTASSFGDDASDPTTVFGFLKRALETREGNEVYTKSTGALEIYSRGASTLLREQTISDSSTETTRSS